MVALLLLAAFELNNHAGRAGGMVAGLAVEDWQHCSGLNPAAVGSIRRLAAALLYEQPYGLPGLRSIGIRAGASFGRVAAGVGMSDVGLAGYSELDGAAVVAFRPTSAGFVGAAAHLLTTTDGTGIRHAAPAFDLGGCWAVGNVRLAAAGSNLNGPTLGPSNLPLFLGLGAVWQPVSELLLALDLVRTGSDEEARVGIEFRLIPALGLRAGLGTTPLRAAAGLGADIGLLGMDYAARFVPALGFSHQLGIRAQMR